MPDDERRTWMRALAPDDAADLIQDAPRRERPSLLAALDPWPRAYQEDKAGGLMSPGFARLRPEMEMDEAIAYLRRQAGQVETIYAAYVLDSDQRLLGVVSLRDLLSASRNQQVRNVMRSRFQSVLTNERHEAVVRLMADHRLLAIPVVNHAGVMQGIVTVDDAMQASRENADRELQKADGMEALDGPYLETGIGKMIRKRAGWLAVLFLGEMLTATAMSFFEQEIARAVVLALFIPLIINSGGNSGSQAATLVIRAALGEVRRYWWRVLRREFISGIGLGAVLCTLGVCRIVLWHGVSGAYGEQFALRACRLDPSSASALAVATLVDVSGLIIYFSLAKVFMLKGLA